MIDEFYNFNKGHSFGNLATEALEVIKGAAVDYRETLCIIVAGYENEVNETFKFNAGCKSRFPYEIKFRDYSTDELMKIFIKDIIKRGYTIDEDSQIIDEKKLINKSVLKMLDI